MDDKIRERLDDALRAAQPIHEWRQQHSRGELQQSILLESAFLLQFERIGEALRVVRDRMWQIEQDFPGIHGWISMRNHIIHDYRNTDLDLIWMVAATDIPGLIHTLGQLLDQDAAG